MAASAHRLPSGGRLIDRSRPLRFSFDGKTYEGFAGDSLASALMANGLRVLGRSYKYHRPRGIVASGMEETNALVGVGSGVHRAPNLRAPEVWIEPGLEAVSQNRWPSLKHDVGALNSLASKMFPAGFYYKTFIHPRAAWKHVFEPVIRRAAGLGVAATGKDPATYAHRYAFYDVVVAGAGPAGLSAARTAAEAGAKVLLVERLPVCGGRLLVDEVEIDGLSGADWAAREVAALKAMPNVTILNRALVMSAEDHGYFLIEETPEAAESAPRRRILWRVRAKRLVAANGMFERPIAFSGNDRPGVMLASAMRDYAALWGAAPGRRVAIYTTNDDGWRTALTLRAAGVEIAAVIDSRASAEGEIPQAAMKAGIPARFNAGIAAVKAASQGVTGVQLAALRASGRAGGSHEVIACDAVGMAGGWSPAVHLWSHSGGKVVWDEARAMYVPNLAHPPKDRDGAAFVIPAGGANGALSTGEVIAQGAAAGLAAAGAPGKGEALPAVKDSAEAPIKPVWFTPSFGDKAHGGKHFIDFQHDVTAADIELAAREGYESVEHTKRYTTLGMATDQGKLSNINGFAILADARGVKMSDVGVTTFRPPYGPLTMGAIAGKKAGLLFKPIRRTSVQDWHEAQGAVFEPVGDWRRPYAYPRKGEDKHDAAQRETRAVRERAGILDASTLGKILIKGPDAGKFLDLIYTNAMSGLKPGRCRYGLMCNDNGYVIDDGVAARLDDQSFVIHTTSGGASRIHGWIEDLLQTEWPHMKVYAADLTEQYAQFAVAGPKARDLLMSLPGSIDFSPAALPHMAFVEGTLAGAPARVYRISFSGEVSYEIAVPTSFGAMLWERLHIAGRAVGAEAYGTEALHILRAEKGYIIVGDETDGTVTPDDVGLSGMVSTKKADFIGKRALQRSWPQRKGRKQLVGLLTEDPAVMLPDGAHAVADSKIDPPWTTIGHVTSTYHSPTLGRSIAMALIEDGRAKMGETLEFVIPVGKTYRRIKAKVASPVFYDPEGARLNG